MEAAGAAGLDMPYRCRSGSCSEWKCVLRSGRVDDIGQTYLSDPMRDAGLILPCVSYPESDVEIVDAGSFLKDGNPNRTVGPIEMTEQALWHYMFDDGQPAVLGSATLAALKLSARHQEALYKLKAGKTLPYGSYGVNLTTSVFTSAIRRYTRLRTR